MEITSEGCCIQNWTPNLTLEINWLWFIFFNQLWFLIDDTKDAQPSDNVLQTTEGHKAHVYYNDQARSIES